MSRFGGVFRPLQKRTCDPYTIYSIPGGSGAIRTLYAVFREGVTKHHYTRSDRTRPSPSALYSVRIARAVLEGFERICRFLLVFFEVKKVQIVADLRQTTFHSYKT